jgi:aminoglycoside phosphotransferase family enzyme/predicted kinase
LIVATAESPSLVRDLLRPGRYPGPRVRAVELRSTHASWVFIVGDNVWKVKRPVRYGFLDFSTQHARRACCEDEVRLNRRLAPEVYLGVEPVRLGPSGHTLLDEPAGRVVDWAVHMRRLSDERCARTLLSRNRLRPVHLRALAARLATFLAEAPRTPSFGAVASLRTNVDDNFQQTRPLVGDLVDEATFEETRAFQLRALADGEERFARRVRDGRCREGHGDLRLEHVYFDDDDDGPRPTVIDCVEFSERFRSGDAAGEAGFLAMELELERRPDLAAGWIARFAEASHDFDLYGVLDFYLSYRAWVRGKVAALVAADPAAATSVREAKRAEARRDFALARSYAGVPLDGPFLVAIGGLIGSGKSTLASEIGDALAAPIVSSDRTRKTLAGLSPLERGDAGLYTDEHTRATYEEMLRRATEVLSSGRGVLLDASFSKRRWRDAAGALAARMRAPVVFVETRCPDEQVLRRRLRARGDAGVESDAREELLDPFKASYEPVLPGERGGHVIALTGDAPLPSAAGVLEDLRALGIAPVGERRIS